MRAEARYPSTDRRSAPAGAPCHIVFVCLVYHPDTSATSLLFTDLFERLAARGVRVTVLCGFPSKDAPEEARRLPRSETRAGVEIARCGLRLQGKRTLLTRGLAYGSFLLAAGWRLLGFGRSATVVGGTDPPFTPVALWLLSHVCRFRYDSILLDVYPDGLVALGALKEGSPLVWTWRHLNRRAFLAARRLIVIGRDMVDLLHRTYGVDSQRVSYIPHWSASDVDRADPSQARPLLERLGLSDKFVVQYSGNMGLWHDMEAIVRAADRLRDDTTIHFLLVGKGMRRAAAEQLARDLALPNLTWHDFLPREELAAGLASCHAALISLRAGLEGVAVPSKLYGILASGRAVVAQVPAESEVGRVVRDEACGLVVSPGDIDGLADAIRRLAADREAARRMGERARRAYEAKYTIDHAVEAFHRLWFRPAGTRQV